MSFIFIVKMNILKSAVLEKVSELIKHELFHSSRKKTCMFDLQWIMTDLQETKEFNYFFEVISYRTQGTLE